MASTTDPLRDRAAELGPISPELCLVDPELAAAARELLPLPADAPARRPAPAALRAEPVRGPEPASQPPARRLSRPRAALPRLVAVAAALAAIVVFVPSGAVHGAIPARSDQQEATPTEPPKGVLVVPDVCRLVYVFAKGVLQDAGFAWKVQGTIEGYAVDRVVRQDPAPGALVVDTGAPTIILTLARNAGFKERGKPDGAAPYDGTDVQLWAPSGKDVADVQPERDAPVLNGCERADSPAPPSTS